jgi:MoxR-like ATPase
MPTQNSITPETATPTLVKAVRSSISTVVVGQEVVVERLLIALLTGGHLLLQGVPGLAKTLLVSALARAVELQFGRVQFTIDLLPADIIGSEVLDQKSGTFHINPGPIFTNLLLADEINRAAPKVQSALLEGKVTIGKETRVLPAPFLVIATQNPVEQAGTFELPEAQLDRFMLCHRLQYPPHDDEVRIIQQSVSLGLNRQGRGAVPQTAFDLIGQRQTCSVEELVQGMEQVKQVYVSQVFTEHVVELIRRTREHRLIELGASPRAGIALVAASQARAYIHGRDHVLPEDVFALAEDVILHRIRVTYEALADGRSGAAVLAEIMDSMV